MLNQLRIKNVALIDQAEITFSAGLNILSGETGSGKSVILDSVNFVLGAKADKTMIRYGEQFCLVEALFTDLSQDVKDRLFDLDIEESDEIVIKRKFDVKGNGYIKLNGENVTATMLKRITSLLVDVHGQSEHFVLLSKNKQLECVDQGANVNEFKSRLKDISLTIKEYDEKLSKLGGNPDERARRIDILNYQINEITKAELKDGEELDLRLRSEKFKNAEKINSALTAVYESLSGENGVADSIILAEQSIKSVATIDDGIAELSEQLSTLRESANDIAECAKDYLESFDFESFNHDEIENRLDVYHTLKKKYGPSIEEINSFLNAAIAERDELCMSDDLINQIVTLRRQEVATYYTTAIALSDARKKYCTDFTKKVKEKLINLGMPNAEFCINFAKFPEIDTLDIFSSNGLDQVEFMFSANAGEPVKPLSKIISGGEMSRFMLALKTQAGSPCKTYVFDEIDAGISGVTANVVAQNFAQISLYKQVIAVSHLAQISAMSDSSLFIKKYETDGKTFTSVNELSQEDKVNEVIRLIGGKQNDEISIRHAKNLIENARLYKKQLKSK